MEQIGQHADLATLGREPMTSSYDQPNLREAQTNARILLGCYRQADAHDPEVYLTAIVAILAQFPPDIQAAVCNPASGLPSKSQWVPTIAEIRAECDRIADYAVRAKARQKLAIRDIALPPPPPSDKPQGRIVTYQEAVSSGLKILPAAGKR